jgi:purine-binding chemotaxis protein CheW
MSDEARLVRLRREFDESFARAPAQEEAKTEQLIAVRAGGLPLAMRLSELDSVHRSTGITTLLQSPRAMLGIAGVRGQLVAVYDLAMLLGAKSEVAGQRWLALCNAERQVALAFTEMEGYLSVEPSRLRTVASTERFTTHVALALEHDVGLRGVLSLRSVLGAIKSALGQRDGS